MYRQPAAPPKTRLPLLDRVAIKTPCKASWDDMEGDDRVRFCCACSKNVYDLSAMTEDEAEAVLAFHLDDEDACVKLYRRPDGRILTSDCPRGASTRHARRAVMAATAAVCAVAAVAAVAGDVHVPRAHRLPRSTARFEVPRPPPGAWPSRSQLAGEDGEGVAPPPPAPVDEAWGMALGGLMLMDGVPPLPYASELQARAQSGPRIELGAMVVSRGLPPAVISRITRQSLGRFRLAYERGLKRDPKLEGEVVVRLTIGRDGSVLQVDDGGSTLADPAVVRDVLNAFVLLSYPSPDGDAPVTVTLPLRFSPS
jgi:hypothetical protein